MLMKFNKWKIFQEVMFDSLFERTLFSDNYSFPAAADIYEDREKFTVEVEVPGIKEENIEITLDKNILTIKGTQEEEKANKEYWRVERSVGSFKRSFALPSLVDVENIQALYDKGILTIHFPKKPKTVPRKIEIKSTQ